VPTSILRAAITDALVARRLIADSAAISEWSVWPRRQCDVAVRINSQCWSEMREASAPFGDIIARVQPEAPYLNIWLDTELLLRLARLSCRPGRFDGAAASSQHAVRVAIEHTSLTPAYPLNIATFRSSAIGVALEAMKSAGGACVSCYFWVEDEAAQLGMLAAAIRHLQEENSEARDHFPAGKPDHVLGRMLVLARRAVRGGAVSPASLRAMFPLADGPGETALDRLVAIDPFMRESESRDISRALALRCLKGYGITFDLAGMRQPTYILGSDEVSGDRVIRAMDMLRRFELASPSGPRLDTEALAPSYLVRNVAWFDWLAERSTEVVIVAPARQREVINRAAEVVRECADREAAVVTVLFGDVVNADGDLDRPSEGRFHSVDGFVATEAARLGWQPVDVAASLRLFLLSKGPGHRLVVGGDLANVHSVAMSIHRLREGGACGNDDPMTLRMLAKRLLDLDYAVAMAAVRLDPSILVREMDEIARSAAGVAAPDVRSLGASAIDALLGLIGFEPRVAGALGTQ
jgi:hypothetical protein